jgi:(1->4)-alpha-D-glucan 1-alpha-D-glucosylmutase
MLSTSTHDTKRAEDVRARMNVLSEVPTFWRRSIQRWSRINRIRRRIVDDMPAPGPHAEYLLYQTLLGTWPLETLDEEAYAKYRERIEEYMVKASREAKRRTSWSNVNADYEEALRQFIRLALERREGNVFPAEVAEFARRLARFGFLNSLGQTLCKLTAPGMPDIYQGNELWDWSLVDPDNRHPVDYDLRRRLLSEVKAWTPLKESLQSALGTIEDGRCKLHVTFRTLEFRRANEALFRDGTYVPLRVSGEHAAHVLAYARTLGDQVAAVVVPRLTARLLGSREQLPLGAEVWRDTRIEIPARMRAVASDTPPLQSLLDGSQIALSTDGDSRYVLVADTLSSFPVALLTC